MTRGGSLWREALGGRKGSYRLGRHMPYAPWGSVGCHQAGGPFLMRVLACASLVTGVLALTAAPASAQFIGQAIGGMTSAADQQIFLGGSFGGRARFVQVDVEVGRMRDILPKGLASALNDILEERDLPLSARARLTNTYVSGNLRFISPQGPVRPFVAGGAGLAHLTPKFEITLAGIELGDVFGLTSFDSVNKLMLHAGGGLSFDIGETSTFDAGYRYLVVDADYIPINLTSGFSVKAHVFYVAFGARW